MIVHPNHIELCTWKYLPRERFRASLGPHEKVISRSIDRKVQR